MLKINWKATLNLAREYYGDNKMKYKYLTPAKFVHFEKTARNMNRKMIGKQVNLKSCGNFAEHKVIVWFLDNKLEYIPTFFAVDGYEPEINTL